MLRDDDLAQIPWPIERRPISTRFGSLRVLTMPPPGAGRVLVEMLHVLERFPEELVRDEFEALAAEKTFSRRMRRKFREAAESFARRNDYT